MRLIGYEREEEYKYVKLERSSNFENNKKSRKE